MKKIEPQLVEKALNYLATRPWGEVNDIIVPLTQLAEVKEEVKEVKESKMRQVLKDIKEKKDAVKTSDR